MEDRAQAQTNVREVPLKTGKKWEVVVFDLGGEAYAINVNKMREILRRLPLRSSQLCCSCFPAEACNAPASRSLSRSFCCI